MDRKTANNLINLLSALAFPSIIVGGAYHNYRQERLEKDPWYRTEDEIEASYKKQRDKLKKTPIQKPVYNVTEFDRQMGI